MLLKKSFNWMGLLLAFFVLGCDNPFPPETLVERLRILAVRADPPETDWNGSVSFSALVADPVGGGRSLTYSYAVCLTFGYQSVASLECPGKDSIPLPSDSEEASLSFADLLESLSLMGSDFPLDLNQLISQELTLLVGLQVEGEGEKARAYKRILVRPIGSILQNHNPEITQLQLDGESPLLETSSFKTATSYHLTPVLGADSREVFQRKGESVFRTEDILFSWFVTAGSLSDQRTIISDDFAYEGVDSNDWTSPDLPNFVTLWVVARDGRDGVHWLSKTLQVSSP